MASPRQLDFSSPGGESDDNFPFSPSLSRRKSSRKPPLKRRASESVTDEKTKKKKKNNIKIASPVSNRIWNEEDEVIILKAFVDYRHKKSFQPKIDWDAFYRFVGGSIVAKVTREQLVNKMRKLKSKFLADFKKISQGKDPRFTRASDSEVFGYASLIWGENQANGGMDKAQQSESSDEEEEEEEERVANVEPLNEDGAAKSEFDGKPHHDEVVVVDKIVENGTAARKESHDDDVGTTDADELCAVQDAFETLLSQGLSDFKKKFQLEKLMKLGSGKRKELSNDWKELCVEEVKLNIKKLRFSAKLAEAANGKMK